MSQEEILGELRDVLFALVKHALHDYDVAASLVTPRMPETRAARDARIGRQVEAHGAMRAAEEMTTEEAKAARDARMQKQMEEEGAALREADRD